MDIVATRKLKESFFQVRISPRIRDDFKIAAELRGASMSGLVHQYIVRVIREEKEKNPAAFEVGQAEAGTQESERKTAAKTASRGRKQRESANGPARVATSLNDPDTEWRSQQEPILPRKKTA